MKANVTVCDANVTQMKANVTVCYQMKAKVEKVSQYISKQNVLANSKSQICVILLSIGFICVTSWIQFVTYIKIKIK